MSDLGCASRRVLKPPTNQLLIWFFDLGKALAPTTRDALPNNTRVRYTVGPRLSRATARSAKNSTSSSRSTPRQ